MHALVVSIEIDPSRMDEAMQVLNGYAVPTIKQGAGFISGTWMRSSDGSEGRSVLLYDSPEAAEAAATRAREGFPPGAPLKFRSAETFQVLNQA